MLSGAGAHRRTPSNPVVGQQHVETEVKKLTATQQTILYKKRDNPEWTNIQIADAVGCSDSHVSTTLSDYQPDDLRDDDAVEIEIPT